MDSLRQSAGDMQGFISELDNMINELNANIDLERRDVAGRSRLMRDYPDVTNEFLHFFLDGIMEAMEQEQAADAAGAPAGKGPTAAAAARGSRGLSAGGVVGGIARRPGSSGSGGAGGGAGGKERFSTVPRRVPS